MAEENKENKKEEKSEENKAAEAPATEQKVEVKKEEKKEKPKKTEAVVNGRNLGISKKHSMAICDFIRGKTAEKMIPELEKVVKLKRAIKMKGEIPHKKGMMSGRYPVNASKVFIKLLKSLQGGISVNGLENAYIETAKANDASRPYRRGGKERFKRTNVLLIAREKVIKSENKPAEKK
jgi:ribosomal protein L22